MDFTATRPDDIRFSLTVAMDLKQWAALRDQLKASTGRRDDPAWSFIRDIDNLVEQVQKVYYPRLPAPDSP